MSASLIGRVGGELLKIIANAEDDRVPSAARFSLDVLARQYEAITAEIGAIDNRIHAWHRSCEESRRLEEFPGVGPIVATALVAEVGDWKAFSSGRSLAAWIGLVPRQPLTGGKERLGGISKQGNRYLRWLLVAGTMAVIRYARQHGTKRLWLARIMDRRPIKVAAVALDNKIARMARAMMVRAERFKCPASAPVRLRRSQVPGGGIVGKSQNQRARDRQRTLGANPPRGSAASQRRHKFGTSSTALSRGRGLTRHFARTTLYQSRQCSSDRLFESKESIF